MERTKTNVVRLYVVEEDEIYRDVYWAIFPSRAPIELLGVSSSGDIRALRQALSKLSPDVVLLGINKLEVDIITELEQIRMDYPRIGTVFLLAHCNAQDIELLRRLALRGAGGIALFMKQSLDQIERLCRAIPAVSLGQVILDLPLATFMFAGKPECPLLKQLTPRELEILDLLAQGYTNAAIAQALYIDIKTAEHHLNSVYNKLKAYPQFSDKHLRVTAAKLYLETMGDSGWKEGLLAGSSANRT